jgi:DNA-binding MarR family transcriptional regulator
MISKYEIFSTVVSSLYHDIQRIERTEMAKYNLKGPHAQCLVVMDRFPEGITAARLCELCERDKAAISRTVAELEEASLLTRREQHGIRYRVPLVLTEAGKEAARNVNTVAGRAVEMAGAGLNDEQRDVFYHVLGIIAQNLHAISMHGLKEKE